jgi:N-hydroxyarylamine O-acetyltransferase
MSAIAARESPGLAAYLERIGFRGTARPDLHTLQSLQQCHVSNVPFENLDVQLRRPVGLDLDSRFDKIVRQRRGGWCFELNGVLGRALQEIGFDVMRMSAGVLRERFGDAQMGNHLCLLVRLDQPYLVDVGFGGSLSAPLPLRDAVHDHPPYCIALTGLGNNYWRFTERSREEPFSFDFCVGTADETRFAEQCTMLQSNPASPFVQNLVVQRRLGDRHLSLRGRVLRTLHFTAEEKIELASSGELVDTLRNSFGLDVPEAAGLWPAICARHDALFGAAH